MRGAIRPRPQYVFMAWCLIKHRDTFNLPLKANVYLCVTKHYVMKVYGRVEVEFHAFSTSAVDADGCHLHASAAFIAREIYSPS
jgi:hypothetical protein